MLPHTDHGLERYQLSAIVNNNLSICLKYSSTFRHFRLFSELFHACKGILNFVSAFAEIRQILLSSCHVFNVQDFCSAKFEAKSSHPLEGVQGMK